METLLQIVQGAVGPLFNAEVIWLLSGCLLFGAIGFLIGASVCRNRLANKEKHKLRKQNLSLVKLATCSEIRSGDLQAFFKKIVKMSSWRLETSLSSVWLIDHDKRVIKCVARFDRDINQYVDEFEVKLDNYPLFYSSIQRERMHAIDNILETPFAEEFVHLLNNGIRACT